MSFFTLQHTQSLEHTGTLSLPYYDTFHELRLHACLPGRTPCRTEPLVMSAFSKKSDIANG